jgi:signal transduction histidine kinase
MKPLPIRIRLTVWYSVMFATAALLLSLSSWWMLRRTIDATIHQDFQERIDDVRMQIHQFALQSSDQPMQARFDTIYHFRDDGKWLQILDENGAWIYRSPRMTAADVPLAPPAQLVQRGSSTEFQQGTRHVRTFSSLVTVDGHTYSVELGAAINKQQVLLKEFGLELLILTPLVLLAAIIAGHNMSRKALNPVTLIAVEARRISDRNLDLRLPVSQTLDEISHLSITLNNMLARIDAGYRSVRDFTANASHELRTPLARLRTEVEVALLRPRSCEEYAHTLLHVQDSADEMTRLTENLLMLARADSDAVTLTLKPVDAWELVLATSAEWSTIANHLKLLLRTERCRPDGLASEGPVFVLGDHSSLVRLLRILLDNACKFTPAGGTIFVTLEEGQGLVTLSVQDSGIGIPLEEQQRVFERFFRVKADQADQNPGSGLGLSLAAWIAEQHQSTIELTSKVGSGSRFSITLPRISDQFVTTQVEKEKQYAASSFER